MVSTYDKQNVERILDGEGDWYTAIVLRFLDKVLFKADYENLKILLTAFPEECELIYKVYEWSDEQIAERTYRAYSHV